MESTFAEKLIARLENAVKKLEASQCVTPEVAPEATPEVAWIEPDHRHFGLDVEVAFNAEGPFHKRLLLAVLPKGWWTRFVATHAKPDWLGFRFARVPADPMKDAPRDRVIEGYVENKWIPVFWNSLKEHWQNGPRKVDPVRWREVQQ